MTDLLPRHPTTGRIDWHRALLRVLVLDLWLLMGVALIGYIIYVAAQAIT